MNTLESPGASCCRRRRGLPLAAQDPDAASNPSRNEVAIVAPRLQAGRVRGIRSLRHRSVNVRLPFLVDTIFCGAGMN
jgi:hypothetical protein